MKIFFMEITIYIALNLPKFRHVVRDDLFSSFGNQYFAQNFKTSISPKFPNCFHEPQNSSAGLKNFTSLVAGWTLKQATARQLRQLSYVVQLTADVKYISGENNVVADCLSQPPD